jgi:hypothetical protein
MPFKERKESYRVLADDVLVSVSVGLGQIGTVRMFLEEKVLGTTPAPVGVRNIGAGPDLVGKLLTVEVTVTDVSVMTNQMSVTVQLKGGKPAKPIVLKDEVDEEGDTRDFRIFVLFKE